METVNKINWKSVNQEFCLNQMWYNCVWSIQVFLENYWYRNMLVWLCTSSNKSQIRKCFIYEKSALLNTFKIAVKDICMFEVWYQISHLTFHFIITHLWLSKFLKRNRTSVWITLIKRREWFFHFSKHNIYAACQQF